MATLSCIYEKLRDNLDTLGYTQTLPLAGVPLVGELLEDLIKTTHSLRDAKKQIADLLDEKSCWSLGIEPFKCDNARLLNEVNQLHAQILQLSDNNERRIYEIQQKLRTVQTDNASLLEQNKELQQQLNNMLAKQNLNVTKTMPRAKKPFISTVRSGGGLPNLLPHADSSSSTRYCSKCNLHKAHGNPNAQAVNAAELKRLTNATQELQEKLELCERKVESRDREIRRLSDLLVGGRPPKALAKDCCYKDVAALNDDITRLQQEKSEYLKLVENYQNKMHEAMERAIHLNERNNEIKQELDELKNVALQVEEEANSEIAIRDEKIYKLEIDLKKWMAKYENAQQIDYGAGGDGAANAAHKANANQRHLTERLNEATQELLEYTHECHKLHIKLQKQRERIEKLEKENKEYAQSSAMNLDEEKIRLRSERDFFQKEFLRMVSNTGSQKEVEFLQQQIKSKDEELRALRSDLFSLQPVKSSTAQHALHDNCHFNTVDAPSSVDNLGPLQTARSGFTNSTTTGTMSSSECVQAVVLRAERERDCARAELERVRCERDTLREKHLSMTQLHAAEMEQAHLHQEHLSKQIRELEIANKELSAERLPNETQIILLKEEIDELKRRNFDLQKENVDLKIRHGQLKTLHEQTERSLAEAQKQLAVAEHRLNAADTRAHVLDSNTETAKIEASELRTEVATLKQTYVNMEREKDKLLNQLDTKTERLFQLEYELKTCQEQRQLYERQVKELENKLANLQSLKRERDAEVNENTSEAYCLRQQIASLKASREKAIEENGRLINELSEREAEILTLKKRLADSETEIEKLKKQLRQYVQEVRKAEDLLMEKERERDEMLEHYRSLSHDAVLLEGNNQSLEFEAAENKRHITELEAEIDALKKELCCKNEIIRELEDKIADLSSEKACLVDQLHTAKDEQAVLRVDLEARKELCAKLDNEKDKLNAELSEFNEIRKKLEAENEIIRRELEQVDNDYKGASTALEDVLKQTRRDLEEQIKTDTKLNSELQQLREENEKLMGKLNAEQEKRRMDQLTVHEMQVQNQELRQNLTDDRFRQARSREQSPQLQFPLNTM